MQKYLILIMAIMANYTFAQTNLSDKSIERKGFIFGIGLGAGALTLKTKGITNVAFSTTLPNIKLGYMLNKRFAVIGLLPGANYTYEGRDRGFEGLMIAGQYWLKDNWWVQSGTGLTFDAPAFYTVKNPKTSGFYTGLPAITLATGYEVWHRGRFALDVQYRIFLGKSNLPDNQQREGISNMFIVGFNWN